LRGRHESQRSHSNRCEAIRKDAMRRGSTSRAEPLTPTACLPYPAVFPPSTVRGGADEFGVILFGIFLQLLRASRNLQTSFRATLTLHLGSRSTESHRLG
jgi:hypothetical protein